jgi:hypothetical protein
MRALLLQRGLIWAFATQEPPELRSRLVTRYLYRIHYFAEDANVWIVHIRHSARRPLDEQT